MGLLALYKAYGSSLQYQLLPEQVQVRVVAGC